MNFDKLSTKTRQELLDAMGPHEYVRLAIRQKFGTQAKAAKALGIGYSHLSMMLSGDSVMTPEVLLSIGMKRVMRYELITEQPEPQDQQAG
jgi:hypothetical protein